LTSVSFSRYFMLVVSLPFCIIHCSFAFTHTAPCIALWGDAYRDSNPALYCQASQASLWNLITLILHAWNTHTHTHTHTRTHTVSCRWCWSLSPAWTIPELTWTMSTAASDCLVGWTSGANP
jgi:hypothetical protein